MGEYDFIARDGYVLIGSGVYNDSELAKMEIKARQENPEYWGTSIEYLPVDEPELWDVADGITIPVYRAGILLYGSTIPDKYASAHYTNHSDVKQEVSRMLKDREFESLVELFDGDEVSAKAWLENNVDDVNRNIVGNKQIARSSEDANADSEAETAEVEAEVESEGDLEDTEDEKIEAEEEEEEVQAEAEENAEPVEEIEVDDEILATVAEQVMGSPTIQDFMTETTNSIVALTEKVDGFMSELSELRSAAQSRNKKIDERLEILELEDEEKQRMLADDRPRNVNRIRVSHRPRNASPEEDDLSMEEIANRTVANIK